MIAKIGHDLHATIIFWFVVVAAVLTQQCVRSEEQVVGSMCTYQSTNRIGECRLLSDCQTVIEDLLHNKILPQPCGFEGRDVAVCCDVMSINKEHRVEEEFRTTHNDSIKLNEAVGQGDVEGKIKENALLNLNKLPVQKVQEPIEIKNNQSKLIKLNTPVDEEKPVGTKSKQKCQEYFEQYRDLSTYKVFFYAPNAPPGETFATRCIHYHPDPRNADDKARETEFPHMAAIGYGDEENKTWLCSGALISKQFVLASGHCLSKSSIGEPKYIRLGDLHLGTDKDRAAPQEFNVAEIFIHPDFKQPSFYNDIGLLKLDKVVKATEYVKPACLYTNLTLPSSNPVTARWDSVDWDSQPVSYMRKESGGFIVQSECETLYKNQTRNGVILDQTQLCVGRKFNNETCMAEGPLVSYTEKKYCMYNLLGIPSHGKGCVNNADIPDVFTKVSAYIPWIEGIVWPS